MKGENRTCLGVGFPYIPKKRDGASEYYSGKVGVTWRGLLRKGGAEVKKSPGPSEKAYWTGILLVAL